jgi:hypothetical protein
LLGVVKISSKIIISKSVKLTPVIGIVLLFIIKFSFRRSLNKIIDILPILVTRNVDGVNVCGVVVGNEVVANGIVEVVVPVGARVLDGGLVIAVTYTEIDNFNTLCLGFESHRGLQVGFGIPSWFVREIYERTLGHRRF